MVMIIGRPPPLSTPQIDPCPTEAGGEWQRNPARFGRPSRYGATGATTMMTSVRMTSWQTAHGTHPQAFCGTSLTANREANWGTLDRATVRTAHEAAEVTPDQAPVRATR